MALFKVIIAIFFTLALANFQLSSCHVLKGSVTCLDCDGHFDLSGIKVQVKCGQRTRLAMATTEADGSFQTDLPVESPTSPASFDCLARILGGPNQLYTSRKDMVTTIVKSQESDQSCTISKPLSFYASCPKDGKCAAKGSEFGSSKTIDLPLPKEWGMAPSSYYIPFLPIIGIP
ncbi:unnamed protein product [Ilex paraguariensis]|uniref:Pollen Ole e 1 allergen and extensin family protein n=1 Tax=Ilex paraguariensis TaxID=185542 RepID=A0ABC8UCE0_9AQUA